MSITTGSYNTAIGVDALAENTTGNNNIALGYLAGLSIRTGSNNIDIGYSNYSDEEEGESDTIRIGTVNTQTATYIAGINGTNVGSIAAYVVVNGNGQLGTADTNTSSINLLKLNSRLTSLETSNNKLEASNARLEATVAQQAKTLAQQRKDFQAVVTRQQQENEALAASLKEQASLLQKIGAQVQVSRPAPQMAATNN
jgi:hypothetical protein